MKNWISRLIQKMWRNSMMIGQERMMRWVHTLSEETAYSTVYHHLSECWAVFIQLDCMLRWWYTVEWAVSSESVDSAWAHCRNLEQYWNQVQCIELRTVYCVGTENIGSENNIGTRDSEGIGKNITGNGDNVGNGNLPLYDYPLFLQKTWGTSLALNFYLFRTIQTSTIR